jgi:hypothetical protein
MTTNETFLSRVGEVTEWCFERRGKCFEGWSREKLFFYVGFCMVGKAIFVERDDRGSIQTVVFAWPTRLELVNEPFNWRIPKPGDCLFVAQVIGARKFMRAILAKVVSQWPHVKRFFALRHKGDAVERMVEFKPDLVQRICNA